MLSVLSVRVLSVFVCVLSEIVYACMYCVRVCTVRVPSMLSVCAYYVRVCLVAYA